jgi:hypothetical protein
LDNLLGDGLLPAGADEGTPEIRNLGSELYLNDLNWREFFVFLARGDIFLYKEYMKTSVEDVLTLLKHFQEERQRKAKQDTNGG